MRLLRLLICVFCAFTLIGTLLSHGQFYLVGQNPASTQWRQIRTGHFQVIYTSEFSSEAQRTANVLEHVYGYASKTLGHKPKSISVILQSNTTQSNAFVVWAPKRAEFYTTAPQNNDVIDWVNLLAVHEFRHVVQISKLEQGLTKIVYHLLGEQGVGLILGLTTPLWFLEGDATATETSLTSAGRGRLPDFEMEMRTLFVERKPYSYSKAMFRSLRDYVPNHYHLGYFMTTYARRTYGAFVWDSTLTRVGRFPLVPFRFSTALHRQTGVGTARLYKNMCMDVSKRWRLKVDSIRITDADTVNVTNKRAFTNYMYPMRMNDGTHIAFKSGFDYYNHFISIDSSGRERKVLQPGPINLTSVSTNGQFITWVEQRPDPRWGYRNYSEVIVYDYQKKLKKRITRKSRLYAPSISPDSKQIVVVQIDDKNKCNLQIIDAQQGRLIRQFANPDAALYKTPRWSATGTHIVVVKFTKSGNSIVEIDALSGDERIILPPTKTNISLPLHSGKWVFFHAAYSGIDNIYAADHQTGKVYQVTSRKNGAFMPFVSGSTLYFSDYTYKGYNACSMPVDETMWVPLENIEYHSIDYIKPLVEQEFGRDILDSIPSQVYEEKKFRKSTGLFNFHSWQPIAFDLNEYKASTGFSFKSQNLLSTALASVDFQNDQRQQFRSVSAGFEYAGWYPKISMNVFRRLYFDQPNYSSIRSSTSDFIVQGTSVSVSLPLNLTKNQYFRNLSFSATGMYANSFSRSMVGDIYNTDIISPVTYTAAYSTGRFTAARDVGTRLGTSLSVTYGHTPFLSRKKGELFSSTVVGIVPGVLKHHSVFTSFAYQQVTSTGYTFNPVIRMPRGYPLFFTDQVRKFSVEYRMPLIYPDLPLGFLMYIQRIRTNLFFDQADIYSNASAYQFSIWSAGADVLGNVNLLRYSYPMELGTRITYAHAYGTMRYELLFNLGF